MKKICFVVQRYGLEVNGGAELLCRQFAEKMAESCEVSVFTTKAVDYITWKDEYQTAEEMINRVKVYRFSVVHERNPQNFNEINGLFLKEGLSDGQEDQWFEEQGPYVPELIEALIRHKDEYDVFIFNTYLYYPSVYGIPAVREKAVFIPDAHDEPYLAFNRVKEEFLAPAAFFYNTEEEHQLIRDRFHNDWIPYDIGGVGIDIPIHPDQAEFRKKYGISADYVIYVGRIDEGKNCDEMFRYWIKYKRRHPGDLKLVLLGKSVIRVPERDDILQLGFVSDEDKFSGIEGAKFLLLPSRFESLSIVVLEAFSLHVPVLVNGKCEVLKGHCRRSGCGLYYEDYTQFELAADYLLSDRQEVKVMQETAPEYVEENYQWDIILGKLMRLIDRITNGEMAE